MHTAKLMWVTPDAEKLVAYIAKVSNPAGQASENYVGLLKYLIKHAHWSPFEMVSMCVEITTTRAIAPQILRHRSFSFQEFSQRYSDVAALEESPDVKIDLRRQDHKNRQNSIDDLGEVLTEEQMAEIQTANTVANDACKDAYNKMLKYGVAKECARSILPLNTPTKIYMSGTLRSWIHYVQLRSANGTQKEHSLIAEAVGEIMKEMTPTIYKAAFL